MSTSHPVLALNSLNTNLTTAMGVIKSIKIAPLISNEAKILIEYIIEIGMFYFLGILGVVVNIINIIVYKKQGLKDSITLGLFALSISDMFVTGMLVETATCYSLKFLLDDPYKQFISVHYVFASWCRRMCYSLSCMLTAVLSLERCFCIIFPFHVKIMFTRSRTTILIMSLFIIHILCYAPIFATHQLRWKTSPLENGTRYLSLWFAPHRNIIEDFNSTAMSIFTPILAQAIVTCCVIVMIHGLRQASKSRRTMTSKVVRTNENERNKDNDDTSQDKSKPVSTLSPRDVRLIKTMVFIVALLSACNIPYLMTIGATLIVPDMNMNKPYHNLLSLTFCLNAVLSSLNSSLNIVIYYYTSVKYKETFQQIFYWCYFKQTA